MDKETVTSAGKGRRVQVRKARKDGFSAAKRQVYLDTLAMCCTVSAAAKAAGTSATTILYHRHRDPAFAQQEAEALESGYFMLEAASVAHGARGGRYVPGGTADDATGVAGGGGCEAPPGAEALEPETALRLLAMRRRGIGQRTGAAGQAPKRVTEKELNESILAKLEILGRRRAMKKHEARKLKTPEAARAVLRDSASTGSAAPQDERRGKVRDQHAR